MKRFKCFIDMEKEEKWLREMAKEGYLIEGKYFFYNFSKVKPQDITIKIDYRNFKGYVDYADYLSLFEDSGWKHLAGTKSTGCQYFMQTEENQTEDIFSDIHSRAGRYKRIANLWLTSAWTLLAVLVMLISRGGIDVQYMLSPKEWYLTPGIWEMQGFTFWRHFLFETPFAFFRGCGLLLCGLMFVFYMVFTLKSYLLYKRNLNKAG